MFLDLREKGIPFEKKFTQFSDENIAEITDAYHNWQSLTPALSKGEGSETGKEILGYKNVPEFCYSASIEEVAAKDYSLVPSKYIAFVNRDENIDFDDKMKVLQTEISELLQAETKSKADLLTVFKELGYEIKL